MVCLKIKRLDFFKLWQDLHSTDVEIKARAVRTARVFWGSFGLLARRQCTPVAYWETSISGSPAGETSAFSICSFPWCKYSHQSGLQATNAMWRNMLGRGPRIRFLLGAVVDSHHLTRTDCKIFRNFVSWLVNMGILNLAPWGIFAAQKSANATNQVCCCFFSQSQFISTHH